MFLFRSSFLLTFIIKKDKITFVVSLVKDQCISDFADMAELADAIASGAIFRKKVQVQVLLSAVNTHNPNSVPIGDGFGYLYIFSANSKSGGIVN